MIKFKNIQFTSCISMRSYCMLLILMALTVNLSAQRLPQSRLRGEVFYEEGNYPKALEVFNAYEKHSAAILDEAFLRRKAEVYYKLAEFDSAVVCYARVLKTDPDNVDYRYFWELLSRSSNPQQYDSIQILKTFESTVGKGWQNRPERFIVKPFHAVNSKYSEFGAVDYKGSTYFSSNVNRVFGAKDINTKLTYYDIYKVNTLKAHAIPDFDAKNFNKLSSAEKTELANEIANLTFERRKDLNTKYNDGPIAFYGKDEAFVTSNQKHRKRIQSSFNLNLYSSQMLHDGEVSKLKETYFGTYFGDNSVGHVTFSPNGKEACMTVKIKGSSTGSDLYFSKLVGNNWSEPVNGGSSINSSKDEQFPFWAKDGTLYYSSDGFDGFGGLDVYQINPSKVGDMPRNIGMGINTPYDDFAFSINEDGTGYVSSNRRGGQGKDDIYKIELKKGTIIVVLVCDTIWATEPWFNLSSTTKDVNKTFNIRRNPVSVYPNLNYDDYVLNHLFPVDSVYENVALYQDTVIVYVDFPKTDTLQVRFTNFCFDCDDQSEINQDKFNKLVAFLAKFPELRVVIKGNTDMFGTTEYNEALGMRRSNSMEKWMLEAGVTNTMEKVSNGKRHTISRTDHRLNRRVDIELYEPGSDELLTFISKKDPRLENDLVINYDLAVTFDTQLKEGYYLQIYRSNRYMQKNECSTKYGLGNETEILLFSNVWNEFNYYLDVVFETEAAAIEYSKLHGLKARVVYLK